MRHPLATVSGAEAEARGLSLRSTRARILEILDYPRLPITDGSHARWQPLDEESGRLLADFFAIFGFNPQKVGTSGDLLRLWTSVQLDYSVELRLFMLDREVFNSSLKGKLRPLCDYFTAVVEGRHDKALELATKYRIAERLMAGERAPLLYAAWTKEEELVEV